MTTPDPILASLRAALDVRPDGDRPRPGTPVHRSVVRRGARRRQFANEGGAYDDLAAYFRETGTT